MNEAVRGVKISKDLLTFTYADVEQRNFANYMLYGPIPYDETLKYNVGQNTGW